MFGKMRYLDFPQVSLKRFPAWHNNKKVKINKKEFLNSNIFIDTYEVIELVGEKRLGLTTSQEVAKKFLEPKAPKKIRIDKVKIGQSYIVYRKQFIRYICRKNTGYRRLINVFFQEYYKFLKMRIRIEEKKQELEVINNRLSKTNDLVEISKINHKLIPLIKEDIEQLEEKQRITDQLLSFLNDILCGLFDFLLYEKAKLKIRCRIE